MNTVRLKAVALENNFSISSAAFIIGFFSLLTKFLALYREKLFASTFGQNRILDAYFSAFRIPDFITNLLILSTLSVAFLPVFTELLTKDKKKAEETANYTFNATMLAVAAICLALLIFSGYLTKKLVPGFDGQSFYNTLKLTRLFLLSPLLFTVSTLLGGILNAQKKFLVTSIAPALYNLGIIGGVIFLYPKFGIMGLGYGVILGAVAQVAIQWAAVFKYGFAWHWGINWANRHFKKIAALYIPRIFTFDLSLVTLMLGTILGSQMAAGSIAALNQAYNLEAVPIGIFAFSLALASFPVLSEYYATKNPQAFLKTLLATVQQILFFMVPISVLMLVMRAYIVRLILGYGNFTWQDTIRTFNVLGIFSFSLFSQSLTTFFSRAFYARQNTKTPVIINLAAIGLNIILTLVLSRRFGVEGITAAFTISSIFSALALFAAIRHVLAKEQYGELSGHQATKNFDKALAWSTVKIVIASLAMGLASYGLIYLVEPLVNTRTVIGILVQSGMASLVGIGVYLGIGKLLKLNEVEYFIDLFRKILYIK
ncbi:MAG: murein biosynthesis integral membrane protein MurJ [Patescibacteria group bacterium]|nr:murein biosynthesis integral membrane protein MurJ [Patescibacteria group bacterium]